MHGRRRVRADALKIETLQQLQDLQHGDAAGAGRRGAADAPLPVVGADGIALPRRIARQIGAAETAGIARRSGHRIHDLRGDLAAIECIGAAGSNQPQACRQRRILQEAPSLQRQTFGVVEIGGRSGRLLEILIIGDRFGQSRRQREALLGEAGRVVEQPRPRQLAVIAMHLLEHAQRARRAHRQAAHAPRRKTPWACHRIAGTCSPSPVPAPSPARHRNRDPGSCRRSTAESRRRRCPRIAAPPASAPTARRLPHPPHCRRTAGCAMPYAPPADGPPPPSRISRRRVCCRPQSGGAAAAKMPNRKAIRAPMKRTGRAAPWRGTQNSAFIPQPLVRFARTFAFMCTRPIRWLDPAPACGRIATLSPSRWLEKSCPANPLHSSGSATY